MLNVPPAKFTFEVFAILSAAPSFKVPVLIKVGPVYVLFPLKVHAPPAVTFLTDEVFPVPLITPLIKPP